MSSSVLLIHIFHNSKKKKQKCVKYSHMRSHNILDFSSHNLQQTLASTEIDQS